MHFCNCLFLHYRIRTFPQCLLSFAQERGHCCNRITKLHQLFLSHIYSNSIVTAFINSLISVNCFGSTIIPGCIIQMANFLRRTTGKPVMTNETGQQNTCFISAELHCKLFCAVKKKAKKVTIVFYLSSLTFISI